MREVHLSAQKIEKEGMLFKQNNVSMVTTNRADEYARYEANYDLIKADIILTRSLIAEAGDGDARFSPHPSRATTFIRLDFGP